MLIFFAPNVVSLFLFRDNSHYRKLIICVGFYKWNIASSYFTTRIQPFIPCSFMAFQIKAFNILYSFRT